MPQKENALSETGRMNAEAMQSEVAPFWNAEPCDSENSSLLPTTRECYKEIEADHYKY